MSSVSVSTSSATKLVATCPACNTRYKIKPYMSGKRARCGKCQTKMKIPTLRAKLNEVASTAKRRLASAIPGVRGTGMGLLLIAWGTILLAAIMGAAVAISLLAPQVLADFNLLFLGGLAATSLLPVIGMFVCNCVPGQSGAKGWIGTATLMMVGNLAIGGYLMYCGLARVLPVVDPVIIQCVSGGLGVLGFFAFLMFMKKTSDFTGRPELAGTARGIMWFQALIIAAMIGMISLAISMVPTEGTALMLQAIGWAILIAALINQIVLLVLEFQLGSHLRRR